MPLIGPSVDRRSLAFVNQVCQSKHVESLMCFTCGQIHVHVACWDRLWKEPPRQDARSSAPSKAYNDTRSPIRFHKVRLSLSAPRPDNSANRRGAERSFTADIQQNIITKRIHCTFRKYA